MRDEILDRLTDIERSEDVRIVFACESGSRAWGFASTDSDYDVRFVYVRRREAYLGLDDPRDVIERPIEGLLDINGWDLRKALRQFRKSNPVMTEWLDSPIVYSESGTIAERIRELVPALFRPTAAYHHYMSMAKSNFRVAHKGDEIALKKYFYILRPLFAVMWIEQGHGPVPMEFRKLMDRVELPPELRSEIETLLERKSKSGELGRGPRIEPISGFLEKELKLRENASPTFERAEAETRILDRLFAEGVDEAWRDRNGT
jgi:predicted nucleotidyltransferase